jgi:transposase
MKDYTFVGVDVAKDKLDVAIKVSSSWKEKIFKNNMNGYAKLLTWLCNSFNTSTSNLFVCMEATGCYSEGLAEYLCVENVCTSVVNPMQIKNFARAKLTRNKNDQLDARVIASFAEKFKPANFIPCKEETKRIKELTKLISVLETQKKLLKQQLESLKVHDVRQRISVMISDIEDQLECLEKEVSTLIAMDSELETNKKHIISIKGLGEKTANRLIAYLPDINRFKTAKQLAAFAGLSPTQQRSGNWIGRTKISKYGDPKIRKVLYMPALVAKNTNPAFYEFSNRLKEKGLASKQVICAVMRKLIHIIFSLLKNNQDFNPEFS